MSRAQFSIPLIQRGWRFNRGGIYYNEDKQKIRSDEVTQIRRVFVIWAGGIGDTIVIAIPVLQSLRCFLPLAHLTVVAPSICVEVLQGNPYVDVIENLNTFLVGDNVTCDLLISFREFAVTDIGEKIQASLVYPSGFSTDERRLHVSEYALEYVRSLFDEQLVSNHLGANIQLTPRIYLTDEERAFANDYLRGIYALGEEYLIIGIHAGSGQSFKRWDWHRFAQVSDALSKYLGAKMLLIIGPKEEQIAQKILQHTKEQLFPIRLESIRQLAALLQQCNLLISNDSGPMHLAAAVGTPVVGIFGATDPLSWHPLGNRHAVIWKNICHSDYSCLSCSTRDCFDAIAVSEVLIAARTVLSNNRKIPLNF